MNSTRLFSRQDALGEFSLRELEPKRDAILVHAWVSQPYANYWLMGDYDVAQVHDFYQTFNGHESKQSYLGFFNDTPTFVVELYDPRVDQVAEHYQWEEGDLGMHILVAPGERPIKGFTRAVFHSVMAFMFSREDIRRVVVEPDCRNKKIHDINKHFGFQHVRQIQMGEKIAFLAFCTREQYEASKGHNAAHAGPDLHSPLLAAPELTTLNLDENTWEAVNRLHVRKCLAEFSHERILKPRAIHGEGASKTYEVLSDIADIHYQFDAVLLPLQHWHIDPISIKKFVSGKQQPLDSLNFIIEFSETLNLHKDQLPTYLEEISATLYSAAFKCNKQWLSAAALSDATFQAIESSMSEGHPTFVANNGRIGFDALDFHRYAPEAGVPTHIVWIAAHHSRATFAAGEGLTYEALLRQEFDLTTLNTFNSRLVALGVSAQDYYFMPVHPWQWFNKLAHVYAADIASKHIVCLGYSDDIYQPQQSIRTFFNLSHPRKFYVKTALSVLNMGFVRGLSAAYMKVTPDINDWVYKLIQDDSTLKRSGFCILREIASVGYRNPHYENDIVADSPYKKMLAALWRESPISLIEKNQRLMTMASLLHIDPKGSALLPALIHSSPLNIDNWLSAYLSAYLNPLLHCYFKHSLVFMPHGENVILVMENKVPVRCIMKDIGEEVCLLNSDRELPEAVQRISVKVPEHHEELSFFTDIFDCFFRYVSAILFEHMDYQPENFWRLVAVCIKEYQSSHPEFAEKYQAHNLFAARFGLSCLNRLQLHNNRQMIDLADPSKLLQFAGELENPIAAYE